MKTTLVILAAGMGSRYGGLKQVDPVGPGGETIMDYSVFDALRAGFKRIVFVIRSDFEQVFKETIGAKYRGIIDVDYAFQAMDDLPAGFSLPPERAKPWGTAHAIRAVRALVNTPFAAINADDFYGCHAFQQLGCFLQGQQDFNNLRPRFAMVGYRLDKTLSAHGSVARGICTLKDNGQLRGVVEMTKLVRVDSGVENRENPDVPLALSGAEYVSLNLWGFTPALFTALEERFAQWLSENINNPKAEWYIPFVVDDMIKEEVVEVDVLPTSSSWFGITYREDKPVVTAAIQQLIAAGEYPPKLW